MKAKERHDIKTDRFLETAAFIQEFLVKHARTIFIVIATAAIVILGWLATVWFIESREGAASEALGEALAVMEDAVFSNEPQAEKLSEAEEKLLAVIRDHGATAGEIAANYHLGLLYLIKGEKERAEERLRKVIGSRHQLYWELASAQLGDMFRKAGEYEKALAVYQEVANQQKADVPPAYFAYMAGQCQEKLGNKEEALKFYSMAKDSGQLFQAGMETEIENRIAELSEESPDEK
jgi:tetratricopeptide (TPR) repeat protein